MRSIADLPAETASRLEGVAFDIDAPAFDYFPVSVGVNNVREWLSHLTTQPAYVTNLDRGKGFAEMAMHLLRSRAGKTPSE